MGNEHFTKSENHGTPCFFGVWKMESTIHECNIGKNICADLLESIKQYPPAPACQGHQGCGFIIPSALQHSSVLKLLVAGLQSMFGRFYGPKIPRDLPSPPVERWIRHTLEIPPISSFVSQRNMTQQKLFPRLQQIEQNRPLNP